MDGETVTCSEPDCGGRGWVVGWEPLLEPGEHPEYPDGLEDYWWQPCEKCNKEARRVPDSPDMEPWEAT